jgi:serine protease Do
MSTSARLKLGGAVAIAFLSGLIFASGFDLTPFGYAQQAKTVARTSTPPADTRPVSELNMAFTAIAEQVTPAVVYIEAERTEQPRQQPRGNQRRNPQGIPNLDDFFQQFDPRQMQPREASGSGFIVSKDGYILTNNHVVADFDRVMVTLTDHRRFRARVIGRDPTTDVALVKIEGQNLPVATLGNDEGSRIGEWVLAIGNPLGLQFTVTAGIVSAKGRSNTDLRGLNDNPYAITDLIQTDAAINPGNSGGPLVNARGEVIGINNAIASTTGYYSGYGFAIPVTLAKQVMDDIIAHGRVRRSALGIQIRDAQPDDAAAAGLKEIYGVLVTGYSGDDSPGRRAGIEPGDVIVEADGKRADRTSTLQRIIRSRDPGEVVELTAMRFGQRRTFRVKLIEVSDSATTVARAEREDEPARGGEINEKLGVTVEPVSAEFARANRVPEERRGLLVTDVDPASAARRGLIPRNDVIVEVLNPAPKRPVRSIADLQSTISKLDDGDLISLLVYDLRQQATRVVTLRLGER